ncbi:MAG: hypothetical protein KC478_12125, partial [Bacteriovoracaceae bacterium]|nr:hypothetical protein [Bacteriovoracaceae bacterium]
GDDYKRADELLEYHAPRITGKNTKESVFYHRYSDKDGSPKMPSKTLIKKLKKSGIKRAVSAHTPIGEVATSVKAYDFEIVMSDVSSSTSEKLPVIRLEKEYTLIKSTLASGEEIVSKTSNQNSILPSGYLTNDGYRVVGRKGEKYLLLKFKMKGKEFVPEYIERSMDQIFKIGLKVNSERGMKGCVEVFSKALAR